MTIKTQQILSVSLSILSSIGTIATTALAIKATPKAIKEYEKVKDKDIKEKAKVLIPIYAPTLAVGTATIASNICSTVISRKTEASLIAATTLAERCYKKYKGKVKEILGDEVHKNVITSIAEDEKEEIKDKVETKDDGKLLYWEENIGYFRADPDYLAVALKNLDETLYYDSGTVTLKDFLDFADAELCDTESRKGTESALDLKGWSYDYLATEFEQYLIGIRLYCPTNDPETHVLEFQIPPIFDPDNYEYKESTNQHYTEMEKLSNDEERLIYEPIQSN